MFFESLEDRRLLAAVPVETPLDHTAWQTVDGAGTSGLVHIAVTLTEATNSTVEQKLKAYQQHLAAGKSTQVFEITPLKLRLVNFTTFARSLHYGTFVGQYDTVIVGTSKSQTLTGTSARNLMVGMGGNDVFKGLDGNDIMIGASGNDYFQGGNGDDVSLLMGASNGIDKFDGGAGTDRVIAASTGTVIGVDGYANTVDIFEGPGDTIIRDSYSSRTLDFSTTQLMGIAEVDAGAGNDTILASNLTPGVTVATAATTCSTQGVRPRLGCLQVRTTASTPSATTGRRPSKPGPRRRAR